MIICIGAMMTPVIKISYEGYLTAPQTSCDCTRVGSRTSPGHQVRSRLKFAFDIEAIELEAIQNHIRDIALLTATNAEDWNYRFLGDRRNPCGDSVICFTHPLAKAYAMCISKFMKMPVKLA
jgi:hypothetical protein